MPFADLPGSRRRLRGAAAGLALLVLSGCAGAAASAIPRGAATDLVPSPSATASPASPPGSGPAGRPAVTVPPLPADPASESPQSTEPAPGTTAPAPPVDPGPSTSQESPAAPTDPPSEPAPAPESAPAPEPAPAPAPELPPLVAPYLHVLGDHGSTRTVYLTFDDGPGPQTPAVLYVLAAAGVKATFCQVGNRIADYPAAEHRVIAEGHTLCNHSWDHQSHLGSADAAVIDAEIGRTQDALAALGVTAHWFRAPGGDFGTTDTLRQVAQTHGVVPLGWAVDSLDWTEPGVDAIVNTVLTGVTPGAIVLLHDAGGADRNQTLAALPRIIDGLRAAGYDLAPLPADGI